MRRSINVFIIVFTLLQVTLTSYVGLRLAENPFHWIVIGVAALLIWSLPIVHWRRRDETEPSGIRKIFLIASFVSMAFMSWVLVLTFARDLALFATYVFLERETRLLEIWTGTNTLLTSVALTLVGSWIAFSGPRVKRIKIPVRDRELANFKIAQITDLHVGPTIGLRYVERVVRMIQGLVPDITVLTGDIVDGSVQEHRASIAPFSELGPKDRVFYSPGNHEYYHELNQWIPEFEKLGMTMLMNKGELVEFNGKKIWVGGITDPAAAQMGGEPPNVQKSVSGGQNADFKVLLSHRPSYAEQAKQAGFNLQLSGHTHGGQFFPWTFVAKFFHQYLLGLFNHDNMWVYVGPGTGTWGPPARLGTIPEITLIELEFQNV